MKLEDIRSEFRIFLIDDNYRRSTELCETLSEVGYQTQFYPTSDSALAATKADAPHIFIIYYSKSEAQSDKVIAQIRKLSPETQIILMIHETHLIGSILKSSIGEIYDYLVVPYVSTAELMVRVDRAAHRLYLQFENEQLRRRRGLGSVLETSLQGMSFDEGDSNQLLQKLQQQFHEMSALKDQDDLVKKYIFQVSSLSGSMPVLYLRFLPQQLSFVYSQSIWSPISRVESLGFKIESLSSECLLKMASEPTEFAPLQNFIESVFQVDEFSCLLHFDGTQLKGVAIVLNKTLHEDHVAVRLCHEFFESTFGRNELMKELHSQQNQDSFTGLINKRAFDEKLRDEISRARRIQHPLSMMKLQIDNFDLLAQKYGQENMNLVIKALARSMKKNFRNTDILGRLGENEFCFLLPHTEIRNTMLKAEKIRRAFLQSQFPFVKIEDRAQLSLSVGVSEYPTVCSDAESLMKSCDEAIYQVKRNQGNRVAVWQTEAGFTPDFLVHPTQAAE